jgi:hypothetical protein
MDKKWVLLNLIGFFVVFGIVLFDLTGMILGWCSIQRRSGLVSELRKGLNVFKYLVIPVNKHESHLYWYVGDHLQSGDENSDYEYFDNDDDLFARIKVLKACYV